MGMPTDTVEAQEFLRYCGAALRTRREVLRRQSLEAGERGLWTMEDVADRLKIGRSTVTDLENGVQWCRMDTVRRYARLLGIDLGLLFRMKPGTKLAKLFAVLMAEDDDELTDCLLRLLRRRDPAPSPISVLRP